MRRYELMLLLRPDLEDDKLQSAVEKVTRAIVNAGGSLSKVSPWGKRRLAYEISHHREASYFLIHFDIEPPAVRGIERGLLITEEILRHMVTLLEDRGPDRREAEQPVADVEQRVADAAQPEPADAPAAPADAPAEEAVAEEPAAEEPSADAGAGEEPLAEEPNEEPNEEPAVTGASEGSQR